MLTIFGQKVTIEIMNGNPAFAEGNDRKPRYSRGYIEWC